MFSLPTSGVYRLITQTRITYFASTRYFPKSPSQKIKSTTSTPLSFPTPGRKMTKKRPMPILPIPQRPKSPTPMNKRWSARSHLLPRSSSHNLTWYVSAPDLMATQRLFSRHTNSSMNQTLGSRSWPTHPNRQRVESHLPCQFLPTLQELHSLPRDQARLKYWKRY